MTMTVNIRLPMTMTVNIRQPMTMNNKTIAYDYDKDNCG